MSPTYKVAVIQLYPVPMQIDENHSRATEFIRSAAAQGSQLAVLPEYHLTGWMPTHPQWSVLALKWKQYLDAYCALAKELRICIVPGTIVQQGEDEGSDKLINVAYFIGDNGEILGSYMKKNLWYAVIVVLQTTKCMQKKILLTA
jgi:predicted amidohydrolase